MTEYTTTIDLRFADFDLYGHVNSVTYFSYLETARVKIFYELFQELNRQGILLVVGRAECDYKTSILPTLTTVTVTMQIARIGKSSFDLTYRLHDQKNTTYATARTVMVCFDSVAGCPVPVPDSLRALAQPAHS